MSVSDQVWDFGTCITNINTQRTPRDSCCIKSWIKLINTTDCVTDRVGPKSGVQTEKNRVAWYSAAAYRNLMDLWVRFMAAHPLHCYRRKKKKEVDWSSQTPETITHSSLRSILSSQSTLVSIGLLFLGPIKRNDCLPVPRSNCIPSAMWWLFRPSLKVDLAVYFSHMPGRWIVKKLNRGCLVLK